ncbi:putative NYN domain containing protein LabA family [Methanonatronarchaeum thermophilum]|uniref:Putative NYN domain containing protein LabA family n=1 Tax=Methanonatronarchaeum thermophilum TaxID=1927129 RepID=A0A1Y3GD51_9EURY|nr:NYN domain-containing protein [Methanonatronarchaeum thermophilum]OUJ18124.1 putative NYN domain containing protein LabA family [Methanonatronarchaeum thermophilum]
MMYKDQRVAVFIDSQNMYHSTKSLFNKNLDYSTILEYAVDGRKLIRAIAYVVKADTSEEETFFDALKDIGFEIKIKELKVYYDGTKKGDWDMGIAIDAMALANKVDVIILVTGDGDFTALVETLKAKGVRVEVISFKRSTSKELTEAATKYTDIEALEDQQDFLL